MAHFLVHLGRFLSRFSLFNNRMPISDEKRRAFDELFVHHAHPAVALNRAEGSVPVGGSKLGGAPDVPADFAWPQNGKQPLSFLAQVNLAEAAPFDADHELPPVGMLYFFYDLKNGNWGISPEDKDGARVFYVEPGATLAPAEFPQALRNKHRLPERALSLSALAIPSDAPSDEEMAPFIALCGGDEDLAWDTLFELRMEHLGRYSGLESGSFLLGVPDVLQNRMEEDCERLSRGLDDEASVPQAYRDWRLLFQLASFEDEKGELQFGDSGNLYFWIRRQDLAARDFRKVWCMLQCY